MARYFKKRRPVGPSKNEEKIQRSREAEARERTRGRLGDAYPLVERLSVHLQFLSPQGHQLADNETRVWQQNDRCDFSANCPGRCGQGSFDLAAKVQAMIEANESKAEVSGTCQEPLYAGATEVCAVLLKCRIEIAYLPEPKPA